VYFIWSQGQQGKKLASPPSSSENIKESVKGKKKKEKDFNEEPEQSRHMEAVVLELFESEEPDIRNSSKSWSSFSHHRPFVLSQSYVLPGNVHAVGVTSTRGGIATREILSMYLI